MHHDSSPLPRKVRMLGKLPPLRDDPVPASFWDYVYSTLLECPEIHAEVDEQLRPDPWWAAIPLEVDGVRVVVDYSDFPLLPPDVCGRAHWLKFQHMPCFEAFPNIGSFPPYSFHDWRGFYRLRDAVRYQASGDTILYKVSLPPVGDRPRLRTRREFVRRLLCENFRQVDTSWTTRDEFLRSATRALVAVHVPGSHNHMLDRSVMQLFGMGVCVVSPAIWGTCLEELPKPGIHYLGVQHDYSDLVSTVAACFADRDRCRRIGAAARRFFDEHCLPRPIWQYIHRRTSARA